MWTQLVRLDCVLMLCIFDLSKHTNAMEKQTITQDLVTKLFIGMVKMEVENTGCTIQQAKKNVMEYMKSDKFNSTFIRSLNSIL